MWCRVGLAALAATMPATALAGPVSYACTAPVTQGGNVQEDQAGPIYRVRGRLNMSELAPVTDPFQSERPSASVTVSSFDGHDVIMLYILPRAATDGASQVADIAVRQILPQGGGDERPLGTLSRGEGGWEELAFDIEAGADRVTVTASGRREEFAMRIGSNATIELACVGGNFLFQDVDWGPAR